MVTWTNRNGFIEMAVKARLCGDPWEMIFEELPKYAVPYRRGEIPVMGPNQKSHVMFVIEREVENQRRECKCQQNKA